MKHMEWKGAAGPATVDLAGSGDTMTVTAVIATLDAVDLDGDTYGSGAFLPNDVLISQWDHNSVPGFAIPVGSGSIVEHGTKAVFSGQLWTDMQAGRDVAALLRRRGKVQEWSYAYVVHDSDTVKVGGRTARRILKVQAHEVSPVGRGAGIGTHTLTVGGDAAKVLAAAREHVDDHNARRELESAYLRLVAAGL